MGDGMQAGGGVGKSVEIGVGDGMGKGRGLRSEDGGLSMCAEVESFVPVKMAISVLFLPYETARGMGIHVSVP